MAALGPGSSVDEAFRRSDEVGDIFWDLESKDVRAEHPSDHFLAPREHREELGVGKGNVQEQADVQVWSLGPDHRWGQQQVVVVNPHRAPQRGDAGDRCGESSVDDPVRMPPLTLQLDRAQASRV